MSDWIDELQDSLAEEARQKREADEKQQREESNLRSTIKLIFDELDKSIQPLVHNLNQRLYAGRIELQFRYAENTITGDHFLIYLRNLRMYVKADFRECRIDCKLEQVLSKNSNWTPVNSGSDDIVITTDGDHAWLSQNLKREGVSLDQLPQRLLSTIVRAAGTLPPPQNPYVS